jgi:hypothetical protein
LSKVKRELMSLGRVLMMSQDPSLAAGAHELAGEAEDAIWAGHQKERAALRRLGAASDISETGSVDLPLPRVVPVTGGPLAGQGIQPVAPFAAGLSAGAVAGPNSEVADLIRCLTGAQANDSGWPVFNGRYVEYPRFKKEWWACRRTYHGHVRDELVSRVLKEKSLAVKGMVNNIEDLQKIWDTLDTCFERPEKYILEAFDPIVNFKKYRAFDSGAVREFYSLFRSAMLGARKAGLLHRLVNN